MITIAKIEFKKDITVNNVSKVLRPVSNTSVVVSGSTEFIRKSTSRQELLNFARLLYTR